ncbi:hypothetical protein AGMMS50212_06250 [Spirochaetia bacterium]|nr:hypothetical protein AGMMS50212_06250 [Spirochaetia bacterium]
MPSLKQLEQFSTHFSKIGNEDAIIKKLGLAPEKLALPDHESLPLPEKAAPAEPKAEKKPPEPKKPPEAESKTAVPKTKAAPPASPAEEDGGGFSLDEIMGDVGDLMPDVALSEPEELPKPDYDEQTGVEAEPEESAAAGTEDDLSSLLAGFGDMPDSDAGETPQEEAPIDFDLDGFNFDDTPQTSEPEKIKGEADEVPFVLPGYDIEDTKDDEVPYVSGVTDEELASLAPKASPDEVENIKEAAAANPESPAPAEPDVPDEVEPAEPVEELDVLPGLDDFHLPSLDSVEKTASPALKKAPEEEKIKVEAISLTEEELKSLLDTIASYPLNLRVTCEKIIAEEVVEPKLLSSFIKMLVRGGNAREAAALAGKILKKKISLPKGYKTGEELEEEQASVTYIFVHKFFPIIRMALLIAALAASVTYLSYQFIYKPIRADMIYKAGYERIIAGDYSRANQRFDDAFKVRRVKDWFYKYAEKFKNERQYLLAEEKYDELLYWYPRDKKGALDYAFMESENLRNYEKADKIIRSNILDYKLNDYDGLLALGDINLEWGEIDPSRYEQARDAYAKVVLYYGQTDSIMERMMIYFIRSDKLADTLPLQNYFMKNPKSKIRAASLAELGGYLLDKRFEISKDVPDENIEHIEGIKDVLLRAVKTDYSLPESHYHLARYYHNYNARLEERQTLETAAALFDNARAESSKRMRYRIDTQQRLASLMINGREFIPAEESLAKGVLLFEDAVNRRLLTSAPEFGRLYAELGNLEYFAKSGNYDEAIKFYLQSEQNGYAPPEVLYRLGSAYYREGSYERAMSRFISVSRTLPFNRRLLNAMGNVAYMRSDIFAAQGYYNKLLQLLENDRNRFPMLLPNERPEHKELVERMMVARNNLGVTLNALSARTGNSAYRAQALGEFAESSRAWDTIERDPATLVRAGITESSIPGASLPYLNIQHTLYPIPGDQGRIFMQIDKDVLEPSEWEELVQR